MRRFTRGILTFVVLMAGLAVGRGEDLNVPLEKVGVQQPAGMMRAYLLQQVDQASRRWKAEFETLHTPSFADTDEGMNNPRWDPERAKLKTPENIAAYQKRLRDDVLRAIGGLPERTPLEPQVVGAILRPGYRVEKVVFQSQPKHYVTALLYLPDGRRFKPPYPGVLVACGHIQTGKGSGCHQAMGAILATNGMAALVFDPIEQGERLQYAYSKRLAGEAFVTSRHTMVGMGSLLLVQYRSF